MHKMQMKDDFPVHALFHLLFNNSKNVFANVSLQYTVYPDAIYQRFFYHLSWGRG